MNNVARNTIFIIIMILSFTSHAETKYPTKLLLAIVPFQVCANKVLKEEYSLKKLISKQSLSKTDIENSAFKAIIDECGKYLGDSTQEIIRIHYDGNNSKANGFIEGIIYSSRVRSIIKHEEHIGQ